MPGKKTKQNGNKTNPDTIASRLKAVKAMELRMEGLPFTEIARQVGYNSQQAAHDAVKRALLRTEREPADRLRELELARLDVLWQAQFMIAQVGDVQALSACLRIMERRAKLIGLDAPERKEVTGKDGEPLTAPTIIIQPDEADTNPA